MLQIQSVTPDTLELLKHLSTLPELQQMRLVGGTALALQYGHRQSVDLDFFGHLTTTTDKLIEHLKEYGEILIFNRSPYILQLSINQIKVDFVEYSQYQWIDEPLRDGTVCLASDKDIAAMKVNAIMGRGTKKDFVDMFVLLSHYSLEEILQFYKQKYPEYSLYRALLSLTYFDDAEKQDMPRMFIDTSWTEMKNCIKQQVKQYQQ